MKRAKTKTHCPICRKEFVSKPKFLRGDLIQHFWGISCGSVVAHAVSLAVPVPGSGLAVL